MFNFFREIYPIKCGICGKIGDFYLCKKCYNWFKDELKIKTDVYDDKYFSIHIYILYYDGVFREKMLEYKFQGKAFLSEMFYEVLRNNKKIFRYLEKYDIITEVPISKKRMKKRGYNQTELILSKINRLENINLSILTKVRDNNPQSELSEIQRKENIKDVYIVKNKEKILNKNILVFDDIFTTGSTLNECSKCLKEAGAKSVDIFTLFKNQKIS